MGGRTKGKCNDLTGAAVTLTLKRHGENLSGGSGDQVTVFVAVLGTVFEKQQEHHQDHHRQPPEMITKYSLERREKRVEKLKLPRADLSLETLAGESQIGINLRKKVNSKQMKPKSIWTGGRKKGSLLLYITKL